MAFGYATLPGDPAALEEMAGQWAGLAAEIRDLSHHLGYAVGQLSGDGAGWSGRSASRFVEWWFNFQPDLFSIISVCEEMEGACRKLADAIPQAQSYFRSAERTLAMGCPQYRLLTNAPSESTRSTWVEDMSGKSMWPPVDDPLSVTRRSGDRTVDELQAVWRIVAAKFRAVGLKAQDLPAIMRNATSAKFAQAGNPPVGPGQTVIGLQAPDPTPPTHWYDQAREILATIGEVAGYAALVTMFIPGVGVLTIALDLASAAALAGKWGIDMGEFQAGGGSVKAVVEDTSEAVAFAAGVKVGSLIKQGKLTEAEHVKQYLQWLTYSTKDAKEVTVKFARATIDSAYKVGKAGVQKMADEKPWTMGTPWPEPG